MSRSSSVVGRKADPKAHGYQSVRVAASGRWSDTHACKHFSNTLTNLQNGKRGIQPVSRFFILLPAFLLLLSTPARSQMNPYQIGMEFCSMVSNGVSRKKAWNYVVSSYVNSSPFGVNRGDPYAPWSPTRSIGGAIGSGLASGIAAGMQLRAMKGDIEAVINSNCPEGMQWSPSAAGAGPMNDPSDSRYCDWNPWLPECKNTFSTAPKKQAADCDKAIQKYDCSYKKYLLANPSIEKWAAANPVMAKKRQPD